MAGKDGKQEPKSGDVLRQGFMVKRSQNKKRFTPVNYRQRWFILTRRFLVYYDSDGEVSPLFLIFQSQNLRMRSWGCCRTL